MLEKTPTDIPKNKSNMNFGKLFRQSKGQPILYEGRVLTHFDEISIKDNQKAQITFLATDSNWLQAICLKTAGTFIIDENKIVSNHMILWEHTAPKFNELTIISSSRQLLVYNAWDVGNKVVHSWHNGAAMEVQVDGDERTYYCNDGFPDTDLNDLIFKVKLVDY